MLTDIYSLRSESKQPGMIRLGDEIDFVAPSGVTREGRPACIPSADKLLINDISSYVYIRVRQEPLAYATPPQA